jgi:aspartate/methionine/tyrosine aminotransferase
MHINFIAPESGMFCFVNFKKFILKNNFKNDIDFADYLLNRYNLVVVPGSVFGKKFYMRFSFGVSKSNLNKIIDVIDMIK